MKLKEIYSSQNNKKPVISYEVFPPKDDTDGSKLEQLFVELHKLMDFSPSLISVTYGAGGSNQTESIEIIRRIKEELKSHLLLEDLSYVGNVGIESVNYYNDSRCESDCQYSQVYYFLTPFFDEKTGNWYYTEKTLYSAEIVNYICEFINKCDKKQKE